MTRRLLGCVRSCEREVGSLVTDNLPKLVLTGPVREHPDDRRVVGRVGALEAVTEPDGRRRLDRVDEDDRSLGDVELPTFLVEGVNGRLDVVRTRVRGSDPIGLDVHAQAREATEVR